MITPLVLAYIHRKILWSLHAYQVGHLQALTLRISRTFTNVSTIKKNYITDGQSLPLHLYKFDIDIDIHYTKNLLFFAT